MAWSASKIMMSFLEDVFENTSAIDLNSDSFKITLWDNDITPDQTAASASAAYATGQWVTTGNEVDVDVAECVEFVANDPDTDYIAAYVEGLRSGRRSDPAGVWAGDRAGN